MANGQEVKGTDNQKGLWTIVLESSKHFKYIIFDSYENTGK